MMKTRLSLLLVCVWMMTLLAACGGGNDAKIESGDNKAATGSATPAASVTPAPKKDPVELVFYSASGDFDNDGFMNMFGNKIKEKFSHVTVKFLPYNANNVMAKMVTSNETLDILYYSSGQTSELLQYGLETDISDLVKKYNFDLSRMEPTAIDFQKKIANGGIYGIPIFNTSMTLYYNKDLFDKFGVKYPKDGLNWDELYDLAKQLSRTEGSVKYPGLAQSMSHGMIMNQYSLPYTDPATNKVNFTTDTFKKLFEQMSKFYALPGNGVDKSNVDHVSQVNLFDKDKRAAMFLGLSTFSTVRYKDTMSWDAASFPVLKEKPDLGPQAYPTYFYITKTSKYKEQAFEVISYLASDEFQSYLAKNAMFPALKNRDSVMKDFAANAPYMKGKNINALLPKTFAPIAMSTKAQLLSATKAYNALLPSWNSVLLGEKDINTALREADEKGNKDVAALLETMK